MKLFRLSELSCRWGLGVAEPRFGESVGGVGMGVGVGRGFSEEDDAEGNCEGPPILECGGMSCSSRWGDGCGDSTISGLVGDFAG